MNRPLLLLLVALPALACPRPNTPTTSSTALQPSPIQSTTQLALPITARLEPLADRIEDATPGNILAFNEREVCAPAKWLKTKVPYFKGLKLYSRTLRTKITPEIKCRVRGWIRRDGRVTITGEGSQLKISIPIRARATAKLLGVQETVHFRALVFFYLTPALDEDWRFTAHPSYDFRWTQRPALKLFDFVEITVGSLVEPELRKALRNFVADGQTLLSDLPLTDHLTSGWREIQSPVLINHNPPVTFLYRPRTAGFSGFVAKDGLLQATLSTTGSSFLYVGEVADPPPPEPLPVLRQTEEIPSHFELSFPVFLPYGELTKMLHRRYPDGQIIEFKEGASVLLANPVIEEVDGNRLAVSLQFSADTRSSLGRRLDVLDWFVSEGRIVFSGEPVVEREGRVLAVDKLRFESDSDSELLDASIGLANMDPITRYVETLARYDFGPELDSAIANITEAMSRDFSENLSVSMQLHEVLLADITLLSDDIVVQVHMSGELSAAAHL